VKALLRDGILSVDAVHRDTIAGAPQGGILSPLLANIALSVLDEHFTQKWEALGSEWKRSKHRHAGGESSAGSANDIPSRTGERSVVNTSRTGRSATTVSRCSVRERCRLPDTAIGTPTSPHHG
jgi:hypothetical protein